MIDLEKYRPKPGAPAFTCQVIRGEYLCTQCLGAEQPEVGSPDAGVLYWIGPKGDEEMVCLPCARKIAGGDAELSRLVLEVP